MHVHLCLLGATTHRKLFMSRFKYFVKFKCPQQFQQCERLLPNCSVGVQETRSNNLNALSAHMTTYVLVNLCYESDGCVAKQAFRVGHRQLNVRWQGLLQVNTLYE